MTVRTDHRYIVGDDNILGGEPIVEGTRIRLRAIVELWRLGVAPDEVPNHRSHLKRAQVFDALGYYADHGADIQRHMDDVVHPLTRLDA